MERKFAVYLPPGYEYSQRSYPVLYLLHGAGDDQTGWVQFGEVQRIADNAFEDGTATPMIIVMPDANTGKRGYFNDIKNEWRYEDFFFEELMPYVESQYRIKREKNIGRFQVFLWEVEEPISMPCIGRNCFHRLVHLVPR